MIRQWPRFTLFPYTTLFRSDESFEKKVRAIATELSRSVERAVKSIDLEEIARQIEMGGERVRELADLTGRWVSDRLSDPEDRKSTRLNSSHANISYAVFCLK